MDIVNTSQHQKMLNADAAMAQTQGVKASTSMTNVSPW